MTTALNLAAIQALAELAASTGPDMTEVVKGGGDARLLPEGYAFGRLVEYIEFGAQPQEYKGVAKDPALEFQLGFALTGEGYTHEDGTPYIMRPWSMAMFRNEKARAFLLFKALNWKGTAKHFAQLLGESYLVKIVNPVPADKTKKVRSEIDLKGFLPPLDPVTKMPYPIAPARDEDLRIFLWDHPAIAHWDALAIEGNWDDGKSKNFIQEKILGATDFAGSALEVLLLTSGKQFTRPAPKAVAAAPAAPATPTMAAPAPAAPAIPTSPLPVSAPVAPTPVAAAPSALPFTPNETPELVVRPPVGTVAETIASVPAVPVVAAAPVVVAAVPAPVAPNLPAMPAAPALPAV